MADPTTEDVGSETYNVYADIDTADEYLGAAIHADTWRSATTDQKGMALVTATRTLDRQNWKGDKFESSQPLQFPRTNMGIDGLDDSDGVTPDAIVAGSIELALALLDGSDVQNQSTVATTERSISAGSVSITNFRGVGTFLGVGGGGRFPQIVQELVGPYLESDGTVLPIGTSKAHGTHQKSVFPGHYGFTRGS